MQIGIFTNCYQPLVNGVVGAIDLLKRGLTELGVEVYIFAPGFDDFIDQESDVYRYPALDLTSKVKFPVAIPFSLKINQIIHNTKFDIIHCHHPFVLGPVAVKVAKKKKIPVIYTFHTQYDQYTHYVPLPSTLVKTITKYQIKKFSRAVDQITTPSYSAQQILASYGIERSVQVIPNPTDLIRFHNNDGVLIRNKYNLQHEKLLINIGRVAPEKNLSFLLRMYQYVKQYTPEKSVRLMIVGDGPELKDLKIQAERLGISEGIIFTGMVNPVEIPLYLAAADLFVMASVTEIKPLVLLEALAAGVPIVAVSAPGADDTIIQGENGLLVPAEVSLFGDAVLELVNDLEKMNRFRMVALQTATKYSHIKIAKDYLNLYEQTIDDYKKNKLSDIK